MACNVMRLLLEAAMSIGLGPLEALLGRWQLTGENAPSAPGLAAEPVTGKETYERMDGDFFLLGRFMHRFPSGHHSGISVLGHDPERDGYVIHNYDNLGFARDYVIAIDGRVWKLTGPHERATYVVDTGSISITWEQSMEGRFWQPLCRLHARRAT
jgi:Protein of unknown function (DUF1579)